MEWLFSLLLVLDVICAIGVIVLVLLQHGKGADMGAAFGSGASGSLFGATGSANFLSRLTGGFATGFFILTMALSFLGNKKPNAPKSIMDQVPVKPVDAIPGQGGAKLEAPKADAAKVDASKVDAPKADAPKADAPKADAPKADAPKADAPKVELPKVEAPKAPAGDIPK
jgi:preprotein translocase subunit SecG